MIPRLKPCPWIVFRAAPVAARDERRTAPPPIVMRCTRCGVSEVLTAPDWPPGNNEQEREWYDKIRPHTMCPE